MQLGHPSDHMILTRSVARAMGLDLNEAMSTARLEPAEYAHMITGCRACEYVAQCRDWIAAQNRLSKNAPANCPNAPVLAALTER